MVVERNGYPIRLIQDNGNIIELMANRIDMNVTRKTGGKPMPMTGSSRFSMDLNLNKAMITIQGVFVDDTIATGGSKASTVIDFSKTVATRNKDSNGTYAGPKSGGWYGTGSNLQYLFQGDARGNEANGIECELTKRTDASAGRYFIPDVDVIRQAFLLRSLVDGELKVVQFKSMNNTSTPRTDATAYDSSTNAAVVKVDFSGNYATGYADDLTGKNNSVNVTNHQPAYSKIYKASWDHQAPYAYDDGNGANIRVVKFKENVIDEIHLGQIIFGAGIPANTTVVSKRTNNGDTYVRLSADPTLSAGNGSSSWGDISLSQYRGVTPETLATGVAAAINGKLSAHFTAEVVEVEDEDNTKMNGGVKITQVNNGSVDETYSVSFGEGNYGYLRPFVEPYTGGKSDIQKSAGDKVQDLWGVINNSRPADNFNPMEGIANLWKAAGLTDLEKSARQGWLHRREKGDYIVGLQLPYNSMVQSSETGMYVPRNFLVPVGKSTDANGPEEGKANRPFGNKGSEENNEPANVKFSKLGFTSGIQGTVTKFDVSYDAGENVYVFTMIFAPINVMY